MKARHLTRALRKMRLTHGADARWTDLDPEAFERLRRYARATGQIMVTRTDPHTGRLTSVLVGRPLPPRGAA